MLKTTAEYLGQILQLLREKKCAEALPHLERLAGAYPNEPDVICMLGTCHVNVGNYGSGIAALERALTLGCIAIEAPANLANAYRQMNRLDDAKRHYEIALARPDINSSILANAASLYINEACPEKAVEVCDWALSMNPDDDLAKFNRSLAYLEQRRWEEGFRDYHEAALARGDRKTRDYGIPDRACPQWDGSPDKTVVIYGEQGLGDEIMFASCIPDAIARCKQVIIDCDERLEPLFRRSFRDAIVYGTLAAHELSWPWHHEIDASIQIGTLPMLFRKREEDFSGVPFLRADRWQTNRWCERLAALGPRKKIGLSWIGGLARTRVEQRSIPLVQWKPILDLPADFISLQWQPESAAEAKAHGVHVFPESNQCFDFSASLMNACDLIVSVTNTNVHLAGALDVPCHCLTPSNPAWMFGLHGDRMPFYRSVRMHRQQQGETWAPAIEQLAVHLKDILQLLEAA